MMPNKPASEIAKTLKETGLQFFGVEFEGHYAGASLTLEKDIVSLCFYDRGYFIGEPLKDTNKRPFIKFISGKLTDFQLVELIEIMRHMADIEIEEVEEEIFTKKIAKVFGDSAKFKFREENLQKPFKVGICFFSNNKAMMSDLFSVVFGAKEGLEIYKNFTLYLREKILADFQASNTMVDQDLKDRIQAECESIIQAKSTFQRHPK